MASSYFEERIHRLLSELPSGLLQTRLSSVPDRNLAIALDIIQRDDRDAILALLPGAKTRRVRQEEEYLERLRITAAQKRLTAERLADAMDGRGSTSGGTWIAPGRTRRDNGR